MHTMMHTMQTLLQTLQTPPFVVIIVNIVYLDF
jgi:hypothetical protein